MGTVYWLGRRDNGTLFELGKWSNLGGLFNDLESPVSLAQHWLPFDLPSETELLDAVTWYHRDWNRATSEIDLDAYLIEVVQRMQRFAGGQPVELLNDCSSDFDDPYRRADDELNVVDSVYTNEWGDWAQLNPGPGTTAAATGTG